MFTKSLFTAVFAAAAIAAPAPAPIVKGRAEGDNFSLIALHSTSAVHLQAVNANGGAFYVGRDTSSFCPSVVDSCPPGTVTAFTAGTIGGGLGMDTIVPGGQSAYIDKFGVLRFTTAHSGVTPEGAILNGWTYAPPASGQAIGFLTHGTDEILACPAQDDGYLIFVKYSTDISIPENCISISFGASPFEGAAAWQYE